MMEHVDREAVSRMRAVTVSREYGSGGGEVAARLAQRLGWRLVDHEVVVRVAQELGVSEGEAEAHDEYAQDLTSRLLQSLSVIQPTAPVAVAAALTTDSRAYHEARCRIVEEAVTRGQVVIVGRGAQVLLASRRDVLHVRIVAPLEQRIAYVMRREGLDRAAAQARVQMKDRDRIRFLQTEHHQHPADAHLYDIVLNTGVLDLESVLDLLDIALEQKAGRLSTTTGELGAVTGLAPYPEPPADFRPPQNMTEPRR
jgi:cytidylate kinase